MLINGEEGTPSQPSVHSQSFSSSSLQLLPFRFLNSERKFQCSYGETHQCLLHNPTEVLTTMDWLFQNPIEQQQHQWWIGWKSQVKLRNIWRCLHFWGACQCLLTCMTWKHNGDLSQRDYSRSEDTGTRLKKLMHLTACNEYSTWFDWLHCTHVLYHKIRTRQI